MSEPAATRYRRPVDLAELIALAESVDGDMRFIAGGQNLLPSLFAAPVPPMTLLDVSRIPELRTLNIEETAIWIGAAVTFTEILESGVPPVLPVLAEALRHVGTTTIRNRATVGGSLGWAGPRGELLLALLVHDAVIHTSRRRIAPPEFARGSFQSILEPREVILGVSIDLSVGMPGGFAELLDRSSAGKAIVAVAVAGRAAGPLRVAVTGVADRAVVSPRIVSADVAAWLDELQGYAPALDDPFHSLAYRQAMAATLARRVIGRLPQ